MSKFESTLDFAEKHKSDQWSAMLWIPEKVNLKAEALEANKRSIVMYRSKEFF